MIKSMTGYGRRETAWGGGTVAVEARSVNHRFCEVVVRAPKHFTALEERLKRLVATRVRRGRVEVGISLQGQKNGMRALSLDRALAKQYHRALRELQKELKLPGAVDVGLLATVRDLVTLTDQPATQNPQFERMVIRLAGSALSDLESMRIREGRALAVDLNKRFRAIARTASRIESRVPVAIEEYFSRMKSRVGQLLGRGQVDAARLYQELALHADRCDVTEEVTRLRSHLAQAASTLKRREPVGKTLEFLLQEMGREVNTTGSKANDSQISSHVVEIKAELEKIREQVQNIE